MNLEIIWRSVYRGFFSLSEGLFVAVGAWGRRALPVEVMNVVLQHYLSSVCYTF